MGPQPLHHWEIEQPKLMEELPKTQFWNQLYVPLNAMYENIINGEPTKDFEQNSRGFFSTEHPKSLPLTFKQLLDSLQTIPRGLKKGFEKWVYAELYPKLSKVLTTPQKEGGL